MRIGSVAVSASANRAVRSLSAASTASIRVVGPAGASCATMPIRMPLGSVTAPSSVWS